MDEQEVRRRRAEAEGDEERELQEWRATHHSLSERVERVLMQIVILGLVALVLVQMLMVSPAIRRVANLMEGTDSIALNADPAWQVATGQTMAPVRYSQPEAVAAGAAPKDMTVTVFLVTRPSAPTVKLLVGGRPMGDFARGTVTARVEPGQTIAIDASAVAEPLTFRVIGSKGVASPELGDEVTTEGNRKSLGMVRRSGS